MRANGWRCAEIASATRKSAISRKVVAMTETALAELLAKDLSGLDLVALMIDGSPAEADAEYYARLHAGKHTGSHVPRCA